MKVGRWDIMFKGQFETEYKQIGGGSYDQEGNQKKIGMWIELKKRVNYYFEATFIGEYNINGQKIGIWVEMDIETNEKRGQKRYDNCQYKQ
ncbi:unnamed protein product [Paramecium sonneborni]|uniref:Uncharacterized protein n=1 Tax=Paramecium sonneborni TaxID=65129 RepID=A0A8S1RML2_9CILI|nr:unnamed protein product [Paramecium sonneborni]